MQNPSAINSQQQQQQVQIAINENILKPNIQPTNSSNNPFEDNFSSLNDNELFGLEFDRMRVKNDQNIMIPIGSLSNYNHLNSNLYCFSYFYFILI